MSVLLPAPFSPISASTSPAANSNETSLSATTPGKRLVIPRIVSRCAAASPIFLFLQLRQPLLEVLHVGRINHLIGYGDDRVLGHRRIALGVQLVQIFRRQIAELERLLHHGDLDNALLD